MPNVGIYPSPMDPIRFEKNMAIGPTWIISKQFSDGFFLSGEKGPPLGTRERGGGPGGPEELDDTDNPRWVPIGIYMEYIYIYISCS